MALEADVERAARAWLRTVAGIALSAVILCATGMRAGDEQAALQASLAALPRDLYFEMVMAGEGENMTRNFALYDAQAGIFAFASGDNLSVWTEGRFYTGLPQERGLDAGTLTPHWVGQLNKCAGRYFPIAWAYFVLDHPERVESVEGAPGGGWRAVVRVDAGIEGRPDEDHEVVFDNSGHVMREGVAGQSGRSEYSYSTDYVSAWMVLSRACVASLFPQFQIERVLAMRPAPESAASLDRVEKLAAQADVNIHAWPLAKLAAWRQRRGLAPLQVAPNIQRGVADAKGEWIPWRWPLIGGGAAVLSIAGYGLWRRRAG